MSTPSVVQPRRAGLVAWLLTLAGWAAASAYLLALPVPFTVPAALRYTMVIGSVGMLCVGVAGAAGSSRSSTGLRRIAARVTDGVGRAWPAALALIPLPVAHLPFVPDLLAPLCGFACVAVLVWQLRVPLLRDSTAIRDPWTLCLLGLCLMIAVLYVIKGAQMHGNGDNDAAYYYGVARHIVRTGRFEEPIVWHFLAPPAQINHPPFDYWSCLTSLLLVLPMTVFGANHTTACVTMALVSVASVVSFWYLITIAAPIRNRAVQLIALLVFAFSPWLRGSRFDTETIALYHLWLLLALICLARRRYAWCVACGFLLFLTRPEGIVLCAVLWGAALVCSVRSPTDRRDGQLRIVLLSATLSIAVYLIFNVALFGRLAPPGAATVHGIERYYDVYSLVPSRPEPLEAAWSRLDGAFVEKRLSLLLSEVRRVDWLPAQDIWLGCGVIASWAVWRSGPAKVTTWLLFFAGAPLLILASPPATFSGDRSLAALAPLAVLASAFGSDDLLRHLLHWSQRGWRAGRRLAFAAATFGLLYAMLSDLKIYDDTARDGRNEAALASVSERLAGEPVATTIPWYVMANTDSPAVSIPFNGDRAIIAVIRRYQVKWILLVKGRAQLVRRSKALGRAIRGDKAKLGRYKLKPVPAPPPLMLFRLAE